MPLFQWAGRPWPARAGTSREAYEHPVYMDRRAFGWMLDGEGVETPDDLIGRPVVYDGEMIEFLDNVEAA